MRVRFAVGLVAAAMLTVPASAQAVGWASETLSGPGGNDTELTGISCTSTSFCMASGNYFDGFLERNVGTSYSWNGKSWSNLGGIGLENVFLTDVSCTSSSFCVMVGSHGELEEEGTLALHWDGAEWKVVTTPNPGGSFPQMLESVSCTASNACTAVGSKREAGERETLAIRWNGTSWSAQTTPNPGGTENLLNGVSCSSSTHCVAVGAKSSGGGTFTTLAMTWNGTTWTTQTSPNPGGATSAGAEAVSCTSSTVCTAVGVYEVSGAPLGFPMHWNGSTWSLQPVKLPEKGNYGWLYGVSCTSGPFCMAVGPYEDLGVGVFPMAQKWNGASWTVEKPPNPGTTSNFLASVSCVASNWCKAAGSYTNGEENIIPFIEHFSG
jgi:hypothetical protein